MDLHLKARIDTIGERCPKTRCTERGGPETRIRVCGNSM